MRSLSFILAVGLLFGSISYGLCQEEEQQPITGTDSLVFEGVKYMVKNPSGYDVKDAGHMVAVEEATGKKLWDLKVYQASGGYVPGQSGSVRITSLAIEEGRLVVNNDRGESYTINLKTREVTKKRGK